MTVPWETFLRNDFTEAWLTRPENVITHFRFHRPLTYCRLCDGWLNGQAPATHVEAHSRELELYLVERKARLEQERQEKLTANREQQRADAEERTRRIFELHEAGFTLEEISDEVGLKPQTIKNRLAQGASNEGQKHPRKRGQN